MSELMIAVITGVLSAVSAVIVCIINNRTQLEKMRLEIEQAENEAREAELEAIRIGIQCILRDRIVNRGAYYEELQYCPVHEKTNVDKMYQAYHVLGGNDIATGIKDRILALPDTPSSQQDIELYHD